MDAAVFRSVNRFSRRTGWLHPIGVGFAKYGIVVFGVALLLGWWLGRSQADTARVAAVACAVVAVFVALGAAQVIGHVVARARPYDAMAGVRVLVSRTKDFSFPSDHATASGAVAAGLWFVDSRLGRVAAGLALVMAAARVYVGAHYPVDVVAGLLLGAAVAVVLNRLAARHVERLLVHLVGTPLGVVIGGTGRRPQRA